MSVTSFAIRHHVAVLVLCAGILLMGTLSYFALPRESFPDVEFPFVIVTTVLDGANPSDIEESVTIPLETELESLEGLKEMRSSSMDSVSVVSLEFQPEVETEVALRRVRDAVDQAKPDISTEAEEPLVEEFTVDSMPVLIYHVLGTENISVSELDELAETLEDDLQSVRGVLDIDVYGGREREIVIEVDPERLHYYDLPLGQVESILRGSNRNVSAGAAMSEQNRVVVRVPGEFEDPDEIMNLPVGFTERGTPIYVRNVAVARYGFDEVESQSRLYDLRAEDGNRSAGAYREPRKSVSLQIKKRSGYNVLQLCEDVAKVVERQPERADVKIVKGYDQSEMVDLMVSDLENGIGTSLILVLVVIFIGLGGRNALLVASAIPFSMLMSMLILRLTDQTLNTMVLFSLILALGMLVDNAIVIIENIYRHHSLGTPRWEAALVGTSEVAWPVITSTSTTVGAFLPLMFWPGLVGKFMAYLPRTVIVVLLCSLFVALVINPALAAMFMRLKPGAETAVDPESQAPTYWLVRQYRKVLDFLLNHCFWTLATAFAMLAFVAASYMMFGAGTEFFPRVDPDQVSCSVDPPEGVSINESDRLSRMVEERMLGAPGSGYDTPVQNVEFANVTVTLAGLDSSSGFGEQSTGPISMQVDFVDREYRSQPTPQTLEEMRKRLEGLDADGNRVTFPLYGAEFEVVRPQEGPPTGAPVSITIFGENLGRMTEVIEDMKDIIDGTPGTVKPTDNASNAQPTLEWKIDAARAATVGLDERTISSFIQIAVGGLPTGTFGHGDDEQDIMLRMPEPYRLNSDRLRNLTIPNASGKSIPLTSVANATLVPGPVTIHRLDARRMVEATSDVQTGIRNDSDIRDEFQHRAQQYDFPPGIGYEFGGAAEEQEKAKAFLGNAFLVALFVITGVMVLQFNSMVCTGIVMASVILSVMGVFFGLLVTGMPFGIIMTGIGVISLAGVVVNNAIVLLDAIRNQEARGASVREAVVTASMIRFRPVLLTAITTILGLLPMALKLNWDFTAMTYQYNTSSSQWWQSMAVAVIFGLLIATVLTLGVVPTLYLSYERIRLAVDRLLGRASESPLQTLR